MRRLAFLVLAVTGLVACPRTQDAAVSPAAPTPTVTTQRAPVPEWWEGVIALPGDQSLEFFVHLERDEQAPHPGSIDIPVQGARELPLHDVVKTASRLSFRLDPPINATWECARDGTEARCKFIQHGVELDAEMEAITKEEFKDATRLKRPQTPKPPFPYAIHEVEYDNAGAGVHLTGTLTVPEEDGRHPVVILISGSGAQDRDEMIFEHRPFWVLADHLTRKGIAVLRVDDRGVGGSTGDLNTPTSADLATDVLAGVTFLRAREDIDPKRIGLIGHSEGALIAPIAATGNKDIAFLVLLAGPAVAGRHILDHQGRLIGEKSGASSTLVERDSEQRKRMFEILAEYDDDATAKAKLVEFYRAQLEELPESQRRALGDLDKVVEAQVGSVATPWFRYFLDYDPVPTLRKLKVPVLALWGAKDLQVDPEQNLAPMRKALKRARNKQVMLEVLPGLNHLFQSAERGTPDEYLRIEETFDPAALNKISDWVLARTSAKRR
jgi:hypothetical protein